MRNVMMKAQALAEAIVDSDLYLEMKKKERAVNTDEEAAAALQAMISSRKKVEDILSDANMDPAALQEASQRMNEAEKAMNANEKIKELKEARKDFQKMMDGVNQLLRLVITGETPEEERSCGNSCGSCSACR